MSFKVVTFGEIMLRLSSPGFTRFVQSQSFDATFGGGEANVAVSLSNYGINSIFVSKVSNNEIGQSAINQLRRYGVNTNYINRGGERLGIYFLETGASQRASKVIYDRTGSSISNANNEEFNWENIFDNTNWFHFTGITPALGRNAQEILIEACKIAKSKKIKVSCDLNFRKKCGLKKKHNQ